MKKNKALLFTNILYGISLIATVPVLFIVYKDLDSDLSFYFILSYAFLLFFMLIYTTITAILNARKFKWRDIRKRLGKFILLFILLSGLTFIVNAIFRPDSINSFSNFSVGLGFSFSMAFSDFIFFNNKKR